MVSIESSGFLSLIIRFIYDSTENGKWAKCEPNGSALIELAGNLLLYDVDLIFNLWYVFYFDDSKRQIQLKSSELRMKL